MTQKQAIQLFEERKVRTVWDDEAERWYFSVVDVVGVLTDSADPNNYWKVLKNRLKKEGNETVTNCNRLKLLAADGKMRMTDVADTEQLFRLIQSIPSPKAEPFKQWMAQVASDRLDQMQDPELSIQQAMLDYKRLGYSDNWINQRLKSMEVRKELTDEWQRRGVEGKQYAALTDIITMEWAGRNTKSYKQFKGIKKENLRDNMTNIELALNTLAEAAVTEISKQQQPKGFQHNVRVAKSGGSVAKAARKQLENQLGHSVISPINAKQVLGNVPDNPVSETAYLTSTEKITRPIICNDSEDIK
jgi:prophage antirepressor-like protein